LDRTTYRISRYIFLRALGVIYLIAFLSLWSQIEGLIGENGILPVQPYLRAVAEQLEGEKYWRVPTLCWLDASDRALHIQCAAGVLLSVFLIAARLQTVALPLLWLVYLSLTVAAQKFLGYQWDNLLLEAGFLACFVAPAGLWKSRRPDGHPSRLSLWLLRLLLFKLMFSSGVVKLSSQDEAWWTLSALTYHYETQPLPTWVAWYAHQLPVWFHKLSCLLMFFIELVVPFFIFLPRSFRMVGFWALSVLQVLIAITGNYTFFNALAVALCLLLVDDAAWPRAVRNRFWAKESPAATRDIGRARLGLLWPAAGVYVILTLVQVAGTFRLALPWPRPVALLYRFVSPFRTVNGYGLFAVMTTSRPEIVIEGSRDGQAWEPYRFRWKADDPRKRPAFVAPHQPRLDWQMWFAALGRYEGNPWFMNFLARLFQKHPEVIALLRHNPFPDEPPRYLRAVLYDYRFTDYETRQATGAWWRREPVRLYCPVLERRTR